jgi:uncharacterized protein (DUF2237 family)
MDTSPNKESAARNVLGEPLEACGCEPQTGFYRDGYCHTGAEDAGRHVVCAQVSEAFLQFSKARGNDLMTARPQWGFPGLSDGDHWCLCAVRWMEAYDAGVAPQVRILATHEQALDIIPLEALKAHACDLS